MITALTAQNTQGVSGIHQVPAEFVTAQIDAVFSDLAVGAVKIGMVAHPPVIDAIVAGLARWSPRACRARSRDGRNFGDRLLAAEAVDALRTKLIPLASVITPNLPEAAALLDEGVAADEAAVEKQGRRLLALGCKAVLIKGGHGEGAESIDYLVDSSGVIALAAPRIATKNTHGTGCSLSSAIAAGLAKGEGMETAVRNAKAWVSAAIAAAYRFSVGHGHGPIHHFQKFLRTVAERGRLVARMKRAKSGLRISSHVACFRRTTSRCCLSNVACLSHRAVIRKLRGAALILVGLSVT